MFHANSGSHHPKHAEDSTADEGKENGDSERLCWNPDGEASDSARKREDGSNLDPPEMVAENAYKGTPNGGSQVQERYDISGLGPG